MTLRSSTIRRLRELATTPDVNRETVPLTAVEARKILAAIAAPPTLPELVSEALDLGALLELERHREQLVRLVREAHARGRLDEIAGWYRRPFGSDPVPLEQSEERTS